jgi:Helix-turn-helix
MPKKNLALKIAIIESGLLQVDVAKAADLHETRLSQIVNQRREANDAERKALARVLKRKPTQLFPEAMAS